VAAIALRDVLKLQNKQYGSRPGTYPAKSCPTGNAISRELSPHHAGRDLKLSGIAAIKEDAS
jgi:hypothetical protein